MAARWSRTQVFAEISLSLGALGLPEPHAVQLHDCGPRGVRVVLTFDPGARGAVDRWLEHLRYQGAEVNPDGGQPMVYPPLGHDFSTYRAETVPWHGWRWSLQCRVPQHTAAVAS